MLRLTLLLAAIWLILSAAPANAQSWPCPNGPGPGEIQIGAMGGSGGVGVTPLCGSDGRSNGDDDDPQDNYRAPVRLPDIMMSAVYHADSAEIWVSTGFASEAMAEADALGACRALMGEGCLVEATWINRSFIAVARDSVGIPYVKGGANYPSLAEQAALAECRKASDGCKLERVYANSPFPQRIHPRNPRRTTFAMVAWPKDEPPQQWNNTVFVESGSGYQTLRKAVLDRCMATTGVECTIQKTAIDGFLIRYSDTTNRNFWTNAARTDDIAKRITARCAKGHICAATEQFDTTMRHSLTIDQSRALNPIRGFFALAWPSVPNKWQKLAIVTGHRTNAAADAATIALCQRESGKPCELYLDPGDAGIEPFVGIYTDSKGNTRTHFGKSAADAERREQASCAAAKVTCTLRMMVDLSRPIASSVPIQ